MNQKLKDGYNKETGEILITLPKTALIFYPLELWEYVPKWVLAKAIKRGKRYKRFLAQTNRDKVAPDTKDVVQLWEI